jgi:spermidine synthase
LKKNKWQSIRSYFEDVYLESTSSEHNRELHVLLSAGRYQLCTSNAVYSYEDKYVNFRKSFEWIKWDELSIDKVLILGLGLGSVPQMLEQVFGRSFEYHAVEIDEVIIELAHKYVLEDLNSPMQIFNTDALHYVNLCQDRYDMIIMDVFDSDKVPLCFETQAFLDQIERILSPAGFLLFNRLNVTEADHEDTLKYYENVFAPKFPNGSCSSVEANYMLNSRKEVFALRNS